MRLFRWFRFPEVLRACPKRLHNRRRRQSALNWSCPSIVAAECQCLEQRILLSTITVTSAADSGNGTLRNAVTSASAGDTIDFATAINGTPIALTSGQLTISHAVTITGNGAANTIIDAKHNSRIFDITSTAGDVTFDGLTLENGKTTGNTDTNGFIAKGAAIGDFSNGTLTVTNDTLTGNSTTGSNADGAAIFAQDAAVSVSNSTLSGNSTAGSNAESGAIDSYDGAVTVTNCTLSGNSTAGSNAYGGAINSYNGSVTVTNCTLSGNSTAGSNAYGGAIRSYNGAVTVTNCTLSGNSTTGEVASGGAIEDYHGAVTVTNSTLSGNSTAGTFAYGGAIFSNYGAVTLTNSTIAQNHATNADGGGIHANNPSVTITLRNTILAQNTDKGTAPDLKPGGGTLTVTHSLIGDNTGTGLTAAPVGSPDANGNLIGTSLAKIDPNLGALADNGGPTQTMALLLGSPAIGAGSNAQATDPANGNAVLTTDQRGAGFARFAETVDMGAFEAQALGLVVNSTDDTLDAVFNPAHVTLRDAVALADGNPGPATIAFDPAINGTPIDLTLGELTISHAVTITGNGAANTIIDAQHNSQIFNIPFGAGAVTFDGLALENGKPTADASGGAISSNGGAVTVMNSMLSGNSTTGEGQGGAISSNGGAVTVTNSTLTGNSTVGNSAAAGAIWSNGGAVTVTNSTLSGNSTAGSYAPGGAILSGGGVVTVTNSTLSGNSTAGYFADGGAICSNGGAVTVTNSTLSGNSTAGTKSYGGAIWSNDAAVLVTNSTIAQNHAPNAQGGGIFSQNPSSTITLRNTILAQNTDNGTDPDLHAGGATLTIAHSLIGDNTGTGLTAAPVGSPDANGNLIGTHAAPIDPKLGSLANNGGPTQTMAELAGSPAIDAGSNALATDPANGNAALTTDQRGAGFARVVGTVDMGAYEIQTGSAPSFSSAPSTIFAVGLFGTFTVTASGNPAANLTESNTDVLPSGVTFIAATGILSGTPGANSNGDYILHFTAANGALPNATQTFTLKVTSQFPFAGEYAVNAGGPLTLASITQVGSALTLNGTSSTAPATITDATHILVNGTDTATYGNSSIVFTTGTFAGQTWTKLTLPTDFTNPAGAPVHIAQNGSSVTFTDKNGVTSPGTWTSPTQLSAYGQTATVSNGQLFWSGAGIVWSQNLVLNGIQNRSGPVTIVSVPNQLQVLNYVNGSGTHTYVISNGTKTVALIDSQGTLQLATFFNNSQANDSNYPGDMLTFTGGPILWQDGTVWTPSASAGPSPPVVTHYTNTAGLSTHVVKNGSSMVLFVDSIGTLSLGTFIDSTQVTDPQYPNDMGEFGAGTVTWQDGIVWTQTANPPINIVATDQNGGVSHLLVQTPTTFLGLDGPLQGFTGTRVNNEIEWSNGDVWSNFDDDLLNTLFEMGSGYP